MLTFISLYHLPRTVVGLKIDWEDIDAVSKITGAINFLTKGCSCKKDVQPTIVAAERNLATVDLAANVKAVEIYQHHHNMLLAVEIRKQAKKKTTVLTMTMTQVKIALKNMKTYKLKW